MLRAGGRKGDGREVGRVLRAGGREGVEGWK